MTDLFMGDDSYHNGAFMLAANFSFYTGFKPRPQPTLPARGSPAFEYGTNDGYDFYQRIKPLRSSRLSSSRKGTGCGRTRFATTPTMRTGSRAISRGTCATSRVRSSW
jgi:hypothetical protein